MTIKHENFSFHTSHIGLGAGALERRSRDTCAMKDKMGKKNKGVGDLTEEWEG